MNALPARSVPGGEAARGRSRAHAAAQAHALTLAVGLCASLPVMVATTRALRAGWQPVADRGIIATRAFDVFSSHMPLVGQYSFASTVTGRLTYSLGPMLYWLLAPAAHLGAPASLVLTMAAVNVGSILATVALARRRGGVWLMFAAAVAIGLMCRSLAAFNFYDIWNPSAGLFGLMLLMFVCWSLGCGEYRLLAPAVLVASFCMQCEDAFVPPSLGLLAVGLGGLALARGWLRRPASALRLQRLSGACPPPAGVLSASGERQSVKRWMLAGLAVALVCWTPPVIDQVAHGGNLGLVARAAAERKSSLGATVGARAVIHAVGVKPWWLTRPSSPWARKVEVRRPVGLLATGSAILILGWLLLAVAVALRRGRRDVAVGAAIALVLCAALWSIASSTPTTPLLAGTLGYTLWWASASGMFVWLMAGWSAVVLLGPSALSACARFTGRAQVGLPGAVRGPSGKAFATMTGLAAVAIGAGASAASGKPDERDYEFGALAVINSRLGAVPSGHTVFLGAQLDGVITPLRPEITFDLRRRGVRALGSGAYLRLGLWYEKWAHPYDYVVWIYDQGSAPMKGARVIARSGIGGDGRRHIVTVAIAPTRAR
ncbi:MAG TPA: hypothetical protein VES65_03705 [Solirubrobacteraceae bacterium]|nr:hypothetical protein [Solirubrobacteraceae bacterium]